MDKIIIDIETSNSFQDVGGQGNIKDLKLSFVGIYSYKEDKYLGFFEDKLKDLEEIFKKTGLIIGFAIHRFDIPVLEKYFSINIKKIPTLDILDEIEMTYGKRIGLDVLAQANLGQKKTHHGLEAIRLYKEGKLDELRDYCFNDVKLTKDLYELVKKQKYLVIPHRDTKESIKVPLDFKEVAIPSTLF